MATIPEARALIAAAKEAQRRGGAALDDFDLANLLRQRYGLRTSQSSISRWRDSPRGPGYEPTMALLQLAGWINEDRAEEGLTKADEAARQAEEAERRARAVREAHPREERETG